jgi:hypothetical protein
MILERLTNSRRHNTLPPLAAGVHRVGAARLAHGRSVKRTTVVPVSAQSGPRRGRSGDGCIGAVVPEYRVYPLDAGRLAGPAQVIVCENDREAIEKAKRLTNGHAEVWNGARFVTTIRP